LTRRSSSKPAANTAFGRVRQRSSGSDLWISDLPMRQTGAIRADDSGWATPFHEGLIHRSCKTTLRNHSRNERPLWGRPRRFDRGRADDRYREGFRMPAVDGLSPVLRAGVRKPPGKEPAGDRSTDGLPAIGDLMVRRVP